MAADLVDEVFLKLAALLALGVTAYFTPTSLAR